MAGAAIIVVILLIAIIIIVIVRRRNRAKRSQYVYVGDGESINGPSTRRGVTWADHSDTETSQGKGSKDAGSGNSSSRFFGAGGTSEDSGKVRQQQLVGSGIHLRVTEIQVHLAYCPTLIRY